MILLNLNLSPTKSLYFEIYLQYYVEYFFMKVDKHNVVLISLITWDVMKWA